MELKVETEKGDLGIHCFADKNKQKLIEIYITDPLSSILSKTRINLPGQFFSPILTSPGCKIYLQLLKNICLEHSNFPIEPIINYILTTPFYKKENIYKFHEFNFEKHPEILTTLLQEMRTILCKTEDTELESLTPFRETFYEITKKIEPGSIDRLPYDSTIFTLLAYNILGNVTTEDLIQSLFKLLTTNINIIHIVDKQDLIRNLTNLSYLSIDTIENLSMRVGMEH